MDIASIMRALGRRWYVVAVGFLLTAGLAVGVTYLVPLTYDAQASFVLLPPRPAEQQPGNSPLHDNPYLRLGGLETMGGVLAKSLSDSTSYLSIIPKGSPAKYVVADDPAVPGAVLQVTGTARSPQRAFAIVDDVIALAKTRLADLQAAVNAPADSQVRMAVITNNTVAEPNTSTVVRTLIVVIGAGLIGTILIALSIDALIRRHRERRALRALDTASDSAPTAQGTPPDAHSDGPELPTALPQKPAHRFKNSSRESPPVENESDADVDADVSRLAEPMDDASTAADEATAARW